MQCNVWYLKHFQNSKMRLFYDTLLSLRKHDKPLLTKKQLCKREKQIDNMYEQKTF